MKSLDNSKIKYWNIQYVISIYTTYLEMSFEKTKTHFQTISPGNVSPANNKLHQNC